MSTSSVSSTQSAAPPPAAAETQQQQAEFSQEIKATQQEKAGPPAPAGEPKSQLVAQAPAPTTEKAGPPAPTQEKAGPPASKAEGSEQKPASAESTRNLDLGVVAEPAKAGEAQTSVKLQAEQVRNGEDWKTTSINALGPQVSKDSEVVSERFKSYELKDKDGKPITDPEKAKARATEMMEHDAITTRTAGQKAFVDQRTAERDSAIEKIQANMPDNAELGSALTQPRDPSKPDQPNLLVSGQQAPGVSRTEFNYSKESETTDPSCRFNMMNVPNLVLEAGPKTSPGNRDILPFKATVQPLTFFAPITCGMDDYSQKSKTEALVHNKEHPGGFYPGDKSRPLNEETLNHAGALSAEPLYSETNLLGKKEIETRNFDQKYFNAADMRNPATYSVNYRAVTGRDETQAFLAEGKQTSETGLDTSTTLMAPYSWLQGPQAKFSLGAKGPSSQFGMQAEGGIYLWNAGVPTGQITGSKEGSPTDWHIRNGQIEEGREGFNKQFADIEQDTGIKLRSQSVLPQAGDNTAPVHMKVPNVNLNFGNSEEGRVRGTASGGQQSTLAGTNEFQTQERQPNMIDNVRGFFGMEDKAQRVISPEAMSATLTELAKQNPEHPELQYVSPQALREANKDRLVDFTDPTTGERSKGFKVGDWVDTTLAVSTGGPGLHVRPENLPEGSVGEDGKLKDGIAMPHWDAHKDPRGVPAHAGTPNRAP